MKTRLLFTIVALLVVCLLIQTVLSQDYQWYRADAEEKKHSAAENAYASYEHGKQAVQESAAYVKDKFGEVTEEAKNIGSHLKEDIKDKVQAVQGTIHKAQDIAQDKLETVESKLQGAAAAVKETVQNVKEKVQEKVHEWKDTAWEASEAVQNKAYEKASEFSEGVKEKVSDTVDTLKHGAAKVQATVEDKKDFVAEKLQDAKETLKNIPYNVKSEFTNVVNDAHRSTQDIDLATLRDQLNTLSQDLPAYLQEKFNSLTLEQQKQYNKAVEQARLEVHKAREAFTNALNHFQNVRFNVHKFESYLQQFKEWLTGDVIKVTERDEIVIV